MPVVDLDHTITIALSVTDRKASARWYEEMLGFKTVLSIEEAGWTELSTKTEGVTLGLGEQIEPSPGNSIPVFGVSDLNVARGNLENAGVEFDGETVEIEGMVRLATFFDRDRNALMLAQDLSKG